MATLIDTHAKAKSVSKRKEKRRADCCFRLRSRPTLWQRLWGGQWSCSWALANHHLTSTLAPSKYNSAIVRKLNRCKLLLYRTILWGIRTQTNGLQRQLLRVPTPGRNYSYPRTKGQDQSNMHQILNSAHIFPDRSYYQDAPTVPSYISDRSWSFFPCSFSLENRGELCFTFVFNLLIITLQKTSHYLLFFPFSSDHFLTMEMHKLLNMALPSGCSQSCWKQLTYSVRCQGEVQTSSTLLHKPRWTVQHGLTFHWVYVPIHMTSKFSIKAGSCSIPHEFPRPFAQTNTVKLLYRRVSPVGWALNPTLHCEWSWPAGRSSSWAFEKLWLTLKDFLFPVNFHHVTKKSYVMILTSKNSL